MGLCATAIGVEGREGDDENILPRNDKPDDGRRCGGAGGSGIEMGVTDLTGRAPVSSS